MSSQPPLSPAEQAAAEALHRHFVETDTLDIQSINPDDFACEARAVVAVLRPLLLEEAADLIENSDSLRSFTDDHMRDIEMAAEELRKSAAALRTTTPEKEN